MARVSQAAGSSLRRKASEVSGGQNSAPKRAMLRSASRLKKAAHCRSRLQKLAATSASSARLNQQALQRASQSGGGTGLADLMPRPRATSG
jgi:hypothetical protein